MALDKTYIERAREAGQIMDALRAKGLHALWAYGKGNGFWIQGEGYISFQEAKKRIA